MIITTFLVSAISAMMFVNAPICETASIADSPANEMVVAAQTVRFRTTQKLRSSDGRELYFYSSGKCEGYEGDRLQFSTTYTIIGDEVRLLDERGNTLYKGTLRWRVKGVSLNSISLAGTTYFAR